MTKNRYIILFIIILFSCNKEKITTQFDEINKVRITGIEKEYYPKMLDRLVIDPKVEFLLGDEENFSYLWYVHDQKTSVEGSYDTIGYDKKLDCVVDAKFITELDTEYTLIFKIIDKTTGVYHVFRTKLFASGVFGEGTLLLTEEEGKKKVDFIGKIDQQLMENIFDTESYSLQKAKKIEFVNPINRFLPHLKAVIIMCDSEDGGVLVDPNTFKKKITFREMVRYETPGIMNPQVQFSGNTVHDYIIFNGQACSKQIAVVDYYDPYFTSISHPADISLASSPWLILGYEGQYGWSKIGPIFYDNKNNRFLEHAIELRGYLRQMNNLQGSAFDCNNVGANMELVANGALSGASNGWALMKQTTTSNYFILKFETTTIFPDNKDKTNCIVNFNGTDKVEVTSVYSNNLSKANFLAYDFKSENGIVMFATNKKIYSLNINQASTLSPATIESLMFDFSATDDKIEITAIEMFENQLRVSVINHNLPSRKGGVIFYEISTQGGLHLTKIFEKYGFCDKVIDIEAKIS